MPRFSGTTGCGWIPANGESSIWLLNLNDVQHSDYRLKKGRRQLSPTNLTHTPNQSASATCTDRAGNTVQDTQTSINIDRTAPVLTIPANMTVNATSPGGAIVSFAASAVDTQDPAPVVKCVPASGSMFEVKATAVSCTATDRAGNSATGNFQVTVLGPLDQTANLMNAIVQMNLGPGTNSLLSKLGVYAGNPENSDSRLENVS